MSSASQNIACATYTDIKIKYSGVGSNIKHLKVDVVTGFIFYFRTISRSVA